MYKNEYNLNINETKQTKSGTSQYKDRVVFPGMKVSVLKIRRSRDHLIFNIGIPQPIYDLIIC